MSKIYEKIIRPALFKVNPEKAHEFGIETLKVGLKSKTAQRFFGEKFAVEEFENLKRFNLNFKNPLGVAAGFDKNGIVVNQLAALGFGFVEVGTVTFNPQEGNEKPRMFRLTEDKALINRLGFNNQGTEKVVERLKKLNRNCVVGVNIGKNKDVPNDYAIENYLKSFDLAYEVADYIAVNVSSPNTPNLRELQKAENLEELLGKLQESNQLSDRSEAFNKIPRDQTCGHFVNHFFSDENLKNFSGKPLLVKIAPDLNESEIEAIVDIAQRLKLSGIIATNTTIKREDLKTKIDETGGLSGKPLQKISNEVISTIYKYSKSNLPIIGVGGIFTAEDAFKKIASGASLVQAYTGFIYQGFTFAHDINSGLHKILKEKGFENLNEAIGSKIKL